MNAEREREREIQNEKGRRRTWVIELYRPRSRRRGGRGLFSKILKIFIGIQSNQPTRSRGP